MDRSRVYFSRARKANRASADLAAMPITGAEGKIFPPAAAGK
ncbi:MAG TPA: hypothetical protein VMK13_03565 [Streptosporangiaceae bacterium]|nr:hypothetical protein [Streptosporangiaceae bacterium]